jgi:hypothetical protein
VFRQHELPWPAHPPTPAVRTTRTPGFAGPELLKLQRAGGNRSVQRLLRRPAAVLPRPANLAVGRSDDAVERAADHAADLALGPAAPQRFAPVVPPRTAHGLDGGHLARVLARARGGGRPLPPELRSRVEDAYGAALDQVRVHTGGPAHDLSEVLRARAVTVGQDVFFRRGGYRPETRSGRWLIAHELAHVVQQDGAEGFIRRSVLDLDELNVVGEEHAESVPRRAAERAFVEATTGSSDYWTESQFPDPVRSDARPADRPEYRALHSAALLVKFVERLAPPKEFTLSSEEFASRVATWKNTMKAGRKALAAMDVTAATVKKAVKAIIDAAEHAIGKYEGKSPREYPADAVAMVAALAQVTGPLLANLTAAAGARGLDTADRVESGIRALRSAVMWDAALKTVRLGVWKVGNGHVDDLAKWYLEPKEGAANFHLSGVNVVPRKAFNAEFVPWDKARKDELEALRLCVQQIASVGPDGELRPGDVGLLEKSVRAILDAPSERSYPRQQPDLLATAVSALRTAATRAPERARFVELDDLATRLEPLAFPEDREEEGRRGSRD